MKTLYIFLLATCITCAQNTGQKSFSEAELIDKAILALHIDKEQTEFIVSRISPSNAEETIIVIPVIVNQHEDEYELNSHIVIANNSTGKITHSFFENSKENGWVSNAEFIYDITIDSLNYKLNTTKNAFGITAKFRTMSQPNPYYSESLSLFIKENKSLKKVLDNYTIYESFGEVSMNSCYSNIEKTINELSMANTITDDFSDVLITQKKHTINHVEDANGDCNPKETDTSISKHLLKFDGESYKM